MSKNETIIAEIDELRYAVRNFDKSYSDDEWYSLVDRFEKAIADKAHASGYEKGHQEGWDDACCEYDVPENELEDETFLCCNKIHRDLLKRGKEAARQSTEKEISELKQQLAQKDAENDAEWLKWISQQKELFKKEFPLAKNLHKKINEFFPDSIEEDKKEA